MNQMQEAMKDPRVQQQVKETVAYMQSAEVSAAKHITTGETDTHSAYSLGQSTDSGVARRSRTERKIRRH